MTAVTQLHFDHRTSARRLGVWLGAVCLLFSSCNLLKAEDPPSAVGSVLKLLQGGKIPESRLSTIVDLIGSRGNEHDLAYLFAQASPEDHWPIALRRQTLDLLRDAAETRKVIPAGDHSALTSLFAHEDASLRLNAIRLAGLWREQSVVPLLQKTVLAETTPPSDRAACLQALVSIDHQAARATFLDLLSRPVPFSVRAQALATLTQLDLDLAAAQAVEQLVLATTQDDPGPMVTAFLNIDGGSQRLARAIGDAPIPPDVAKLVLRQMYGIGRSDAELSNVLGKIAGLADNPEPPTAEEVARLIQEVEQHGDAHRGEAVFRRADLSCFKCHALNKAGGQIGPDLSALGASSPMEYVITSVLDPDQAIKEAYITKVVVTLDGRIHQGLVVDRTDERLILKDANGIETVVPVSDIEEEIEGKSLMPKGLVKFMTHEEFLDLAKFLSQLGRPGPFAVRTTPRVQRWRYLSQLDPDLVENIPNETTLASVALLSPEWKSIYARMDGTLPLDEVRAATGTEIVYVQGEIEALTGGKVAIRLETSAPFTLWFNGQAIPDAEKPTAQLQPGRNNVTLRLTLADDQPQELQLEFTRLPGSSAEFQVVDGP